MAVLRGDLQEMDLIKIEKSELQKIFPHLLFWTVFISYETATVFFAAKGFAPFIDYVTHYLLNIGLFYANAYLVLRFAYGKKNFLFKGILLGFSVLIVYLCVKHILNLFFVNSGIYTNDEVGDITTFFSKGISRIIYFICLSTAYIFSVSALAHRKQVDKLQLQQLESQLEKQRLEKDLLAAENAYLKAQINPHFVFNSLNFIQNYVAGYTEKGSELIIQLAEVMRYAFAEPTPDGKVNLSDEVEHLYSYLYLNQQRFNQQLFIDVQVNGDTENTRIIPLVLISVLENMFKYGELADSSTPAKFCLNADEDGVSLSVQNKKAKRSHVYSSGIGMSNMQKRLDQFYPGKYQLDVVQNVSHYKLNLNIAIPATYDVLYH